MNAARVLVAALCVSGSLCNVQKSQAQLTLSGSFPVGYLGVSLGVDPTTGEVWGYARFGAVLNRYSRTGALLGTIPRPGESADDADIEFTTAPLTLAGVPLPVGTMLFING